MTSLLEGTDRMVTRGTDIGARIDGTDGPAAARAHGERGAGNAFDTHHRSTAAGAGAGDCKSDHSADDNAV